jgi:hypothetical protein
MYHLAQAALSPRGASAPVLAAATQFEAIRRYVEQGGSVLILAAEGGEAKSGTNVNYLLEEYVSRACLACRRVSPRKSDFDMEAHVLALTSLRLWRWRAGLASQ